ncbi:MAG: hypothetical protein CL734_03655 [Chloroflexi bacterium]|nr:hypothetical protein [Chloroflexota bacterium]
MKILHTADIHIGVENYGKIDPETRTSTRLSDFLRSFDEIVSFAIQETVDLVIIAGDAYKSRNPSQTHQREFAKRISKLSINNIPVFILIGNHDSPNIPGPATALEIFPTLDVEKVTIGDQLSNYDISTKSGPIQIVSVPWIRKGDLSDSKISTTQTIEEINEEIQKIIIYRISELVDSLDPKLPAILVGHLSTESAITSSEKSMMLSKDYLIPTQNLALPKLDYVALGHIHRHQQLNQNPRVVYSGSIERIDFGEENDTKGFCLLEIDPKKSWGQREVEFQFIPVNSRKFKTIKVEIDNQDLEPTQTILDEIARHEIKDSIIQLIIEMSASQSKNVFDNEIRKALSEAYLIAAVKRNIRAETQPRLDTNFSDNISPIEVLKEYLNHRDLDDTKKNAIIDKGYDLINQINEES